MSFWDEAPTEALYNPALPPEEQEITHDSLGRPRQDRSGIYPTKRDTFQLYVRRDGKQQYVGTYATEMEAYHAKLEFIETGKKQRPENKEKGYKPRLNRDIPLEQLIIEANKEGYGLQDQSPPPSNKNFYNQLMNTEVAPDPKEIITDPESDFLTKPFDFQ